jgi:deazaflavin-dependent oxidoreductase (nitroreductase family)
MEVVLLIVVLSVVAIAVLGVVFVVGMRRKTPVVLDAVRRSGRAMKPLVLRSAGSAGTSTGVVHHVGRTSGRPYETPVEAVPTDGGFAIALPYGLNTDWLKNVLAAGRATIVTDGEEHDVIHPEVVPLETVDSAFAPRERKRHRQFRVVQALRVDAVARDGGVAATPA